MTVPSRTLPVIRLRALEPEDLALLYTIENDPQLWHVAASPGPFSRYALRRYLSEQPQDFFTSGELRLVIESERSGEVLGVIDLTGHSAADRRAEVGIALLSEQRGKGYGAAALMELEEYACRFLQIRMLYVLVSASAHPACLRLFLSAGYEETAVLPAWHRGLHGYEDVHLLMKNFEKND